MNETGIAAIGIALIFLMTTAGSALVFFFKKDISAKVNAAFLGFASGVMVAASVFGLLVPAMEQAEISENSTGCLRPWDFWRAARF